MLLAGLDVLEVLHANMNRHALAMINDLIKAFFIEFCSPAPKIEVNCGEITFFYLVWNKKCFNCFELAAELYSISG